MNELGHHNLFQMGISYDRKRSTIALNPGRMKIDMGGVNALLTPGEVVAECILSMIEDGFVHESNGKFLNTDRTEHPW